MTSHLHRLRIAGLGHSLNLEVDPDSTSVEDLKALIETHTSLPPCYQRLLARGTKLDAAATTTKGDTNNDNDETDTTTGTSPSLNEAGVKDRTKIMLLHSAVYAQEKEGFEDLGVISRKIDELATKVAALLLNDSEAAKDGAITAENGIGAETMTPKLVTELVTRLCCRLDEVDTAGSANLRAQRKVLLKKAEAIEKNITM